MKNIAISIKLVILVAFLIALMLFLGIAGMISNKSSAEALRTVYEDRTIPLGQLAEISYLMQRNRILVMDMLLDQSTENLDRREKEYKANLSQVQHLWNEYMNSYLTLEEKGLAEDFATLQHKYVEEALNPAVVSIRQSDVGLAKVIYEGKISPIAKKFHEAELALTNLQLRIAQGEYVAAERRKTINIWIAVILLGSAVVVGTLFGWTVTRGITHSLGVASEVLLAVAKGDLTKSVKVTSKDEVGRMLEAVQKMRDSLTDVVVVVRNGSETVLTASSEIAQGNQDLSVRTESQASALEQTAASMEELSSTVSQNAENAQQARQFAQNASAVALQGGEVVGQVVETMHGISDSSKKISDIIGVIDSIAFQTNILALNAAVEAARAGEQGRGFAVVAGEVRTLAGRSADAAKEIKALISESVDRVEKGSQLVAHAGVTMQEIVYSIQRVTDIMAEISSASNEQSSGVAQIGGAITQMDQVTQQNAALVEEMAAAASSLRSRSEELFNAVAVFKIAPGISTVHVG